MQETKTAQRKLFEDISASFGENLLRAMLVSDTDENGEPRKLTQQELAHKSGVGRSTIAKYNTIKKRAGEINSNPDLESICRLASALHVPPALLLMRSSDWSQLIQAVIFLTDAAKDAAIQQIASEIESSKAKDAVTMAGFGLKLAIRFGIYKGTVPSPDDAATARLIRNRNIQIKKGIWATTTLPSLARISRGHIAQLMTLCAIMGAHQSPTV